MAAELKFYEKYSLESGIYILSPVKNDFEDLYIKVRSKEKRIYSDKEIKLLPFTSEANPHKKEWDVRAKSFLHFHKYLKAKKENLNFFDLGSGNGWFCGQLSKNYDHHYHCIDVNLTELKQAKRVFNSENLKFIYADISSVQFPKNYFDLITINAAIQYFPNLTELIKLLFDLIKANGEIHILDSPMYSDREVANAMRRTMEYYSSIGFPEMAGRYYHHSWPELSGFNYKLLYNPGKFTIRIKKIFGMKDSPFPWIVIKK